MGGFGEYRSSASCGFCLVELIIEGGFEIDVVSEVAWTSGTHNEIWFMEWLPLGCSL